MRELRRRIPVLDRKRGLPFGSRPRGRLRGGRALFPSPSGSGSSVFSRLARDCITVLYILTGLLSSHLWGGGLRDHANCDLLAEFPYFGPPHNISVPSHAASPIATELRATFRRHVMKEDVMNRLEEVLYTAKVHTTGARAGMSRSSDGRLEVRLSRPGSPGTGTNPEQLLAAGWSACFESAMEFAARNMKITLPADHAVDAEIDLGPEGGAFSLAARLYVTLPGMERATAQRLVEAAHLVCPYSRATHGNIAVETTLV